MSSLVFGCPNCQQPFQVAASQAGQVVQCPSCAQAVEIPVDAFAAAPAPAPQEPQAFGCPSCGGQFGVTPDMDGQQVACPHCQAPTAIQLNAPASPTPPAPIAPEPEEEESPVIKTNLPVSRKKKRNLRKLAKSKGPAQIDMELFAPGHKDEPAAPTPPVQPPTPPSAVPPAPQAAPPRTAKPEPRASTPATESKPPSLTTPVPPKKRSKPGPAPAADRPAESKTPSASLPPLVPKLRPGDPGLKSKPDSAPASQGSAPQAPAPSGQNQSQSVESQSVEATSSETDAKIAVDLPEQDSRALIAHLLPPTFDVLDPSRMSVGRGNEKFKVFLPDGQGGTAQLDNRVLRVKHGQREVQLVSMTPQQRARKRLIQNIIAILIGIAVMALAFTILM